MESLLVQLPLDEDFSVLVHVFELYIHHRRYKNFGKCLENLIKGLLDKT